MPVSGRDIRRDIKVVLKNKLLVLVNQSAFPEALMVDYLLVQICVIAKILNELVLVYDSIDMKAQWIATDNGIRLRIGSAQIDL